MHLHGIGYSQDESLVLCMCTGYGRLVSLFSCRCVGFCYMLHILLVMYSCVGMMRVQSNAAAVSCWHGIGINCHDIKGVKSMRIQCGVTLGEVDFLKLRQRFSGLGIFDKSNVLQIGA
jgi:hypothetical protein